MLNLAPQWRDGMPHFISLLAQEKQPEEAFREAFGKSMDQALTVLPLYLKSVRSGVVPAILDQPDPPRVDRIADAEAAMACAGLALAVSRPDLAQSIAAKVKDSAAAEGMRGAIALAGSRPDDARRHFDRAIQLGSRDASLYFEYAMLEHESGRPDAELLRKTIEIDPGFADAQFLIGVRETDAGEYRSALEHLRAAVSLHPDRATYWHALGYAQAKAGAYQDSQVSARRTIASAETDAEEQMGRALLRLSDEIPAPRESRPAVNIPRSWENRKGDARVEGTLVEFDCDGTPPRLRIRDATGAIVTLQAQHPGQIELVNAPEATLQLTCGPQNRRVVVDYEQASGDVTRIEFRL